MSRTISVGTAGRERVIEPADLETLSLNKWREMMTIRKAVVDKPPKRTFNVSDEVRAKRALNAKRIATELAAKKREVREAYQSSHSLKSNEWYCEECRRILRVKSLSRHQRTQMHLDNVRRSAHQELPTPNTETAHDTAEWNTCCAASESETCLPCQPDTLLLGDFVDV